MVRAILNFDEAHLLLLLVISDDSITVLWSNQEVLHCVPKGALNSTLLATCEVLPSALEHTYVLPRTRHKPRCQLLFGCRLQGQW